MAAKRIETQLTIRAIDKYSGKLKAMKTLTGRFADGVRTQMSALQKMRGPLKLIEDFREKQKVVAKSGQALEKVREKQKQLLLQIKATRNPTAQMRREFDRAHAAATRLQKTHARKRQELNALRAGLRQAGVATSKLASEERRLAADADRATTALGRQVEKMKRLETQQNRLAKAREKMDRSLARATNLSFVGNASMNVGRRILSFMSGPVEKAIDFESAMSDVRKVVDFDSPEGFKEMSNDIRELSTRIPKTASELAQITAAGGQSGLANEELLQFTEMAAKIGVAFDISAQQSGTAMANIKTALGLTLDETGLLFDAMNHLSNEMATTAPKVLEFTKRVAVDGKVKGFNATETLAFGAAMTAAGAQSDVAATSFRNMGKVLVRGTAATGKQKSAFAALGLSAVDVAKRMSKDATGTVLDVFERINKIPKEAQSTTISQLFGDEARALAPIIDNLDLLREALGRVSEEEKYQGSAEKEYAVRAATTRNKIQLLRNEMDELGRSIGDVLMPPLNALLDTARPIIKSITEWTKAHPKLTKYLAVTAVAVGGLAAAGGALLTTAAALIGTLAVLRFGMTFLGTRAGATGAGLSAVGSGLGTIVTPLGRFNRRRARGVRRVGGALGTIAAITGLALVADELDMLNTALFALSMISFANLGKLPKLMVWMPPQKGIIMCQGDVALTSQK